MPIKLIDPEQVFEVYYAIGIHRSIPKLCEVLPQQYTEGIPSEGTLKKWSVKYNWQNKIVVRDQAAYEGVAEKMTAAMVDTKIKELDQLDSAYSEIESIKPLILAALKSEQGIEIMPETTQDMTALYNAISRLNTTQVKIVEVARKIRGEHDKVEVTGSLKHVVTSDSDTLKTANKLADLLSNKNV